MNRTRQIPAVDANIRDKILQQPEIPAQAKIRPNYSPYNQGHMINQPRRNMGNFFNKLRSGNTQALLSNSCSSMREFCNNVQNITTDLSNLLSSIENILPIVTTYLSVTQPRETIAVAPETPRLSGQYEATLQNAMTASPKPTMPLQSNNYQRPQQNPPPAPTKPAPVIAENMPKQPRPEDIQQLLENPLVKNLLTSFMQNTSAKK